MVNLGDRLREPDRRSYLSRPTRAESERGLSFRRYCALTAGEGADYLGVEPKEATNSQAWENTCFRLLVDPRSARLEEACHVSRIPKALLRRCASDTLFVHGFSLDRQPSFMMTSLKLGTWSQGARGAGQARRNGFTSIPQWVGMNAAIRSRTPVKRSLSCTTSCRNSSSVRFDLN